MLLQRHKYVLEATEAQVGMLGHLLYFQIPLGVYTKYRHYHLNFPVEKSQVSVFCGSFMLHVPCGFWGFWLLFCDIWKYGFAAIV